MTVSKKFKQHFPDAVAISAIIMALLIALRAPWQFVDYIFSVVFHGVMISAFLIPSLAFFYAILSPFKKAVDEVAADPEAPSPPLLIKVSFVGRNLGVLISSLFSIYCFAIFAAALSQNIFLAITSIAALTTAFKIQSSRENLPVRIIIAAATGCVIFSIAFLISCKALPSFIALAAIAIVSTSAAFKKIINLRRSGSPWKIIHDNRLLFAAAGILAIFLHISWAQAYFLKNVPELISANSSPGAGSDMVFSPDENSFVLLDKSNDSMLLLDSYTLLEKTSLQIEGYPRDIEYDVEKNIYYIAVHYSATGSIYAVTDNPAGILKKGFAAKGSCSQVNAIAIDYQNDRVLVGCDDTGEVYAVRRDTLEITGKPVAGPSPAGFGLVRIIVLPGGKEAVTTGCLLGPYMNIINLEKWKTTRSKYTGYLSWEMIRDDKRGLLYISLPLRSSVAVVDEKTLKTMRLLPAGLGARALALDEAGNRLFIGNQIASTTDVYDLETWKKTNTFYSPRPRYMLYMQKDNTLITAGSSGVFKQSAAFSH